MAANDSKRYYWLKLRKDFFQQHQMKVLKALPNGRLYALIYLELLAESTTHNGELRYSELMPYDIITLATVIDEDKDNVEKAIQTFIKLELVEILDDRTIFMREISKLIGSETGQTIRKNEAKLTSGVNFTPNLPQNYPRDKSIENRVKSKEILPKGSTKKFQKPTIEEISSYLGEIGVEKPGELATDIFDYYESKGWLVGKSPMKDWKATCRRWIKNNKNWDKQSSSKKLPDFEMPDYMNSSTPKTEEDLWSK